MNEINDLIYKNESLIYSIINKYSYYFDKEDLYQVAVLGLINAYKNYNNDKNTKFSSYAYFYISGEVKKYLRENNIIKPNKDLLKLNEKIEEASSLLSQKLYREPTELELSLFLEIDISKIREAKISKYTISSLDKDIDDDYNLYDKVSIYEKEYNEELLDLKIELDKLSDIDKEIITERYINDLSQSETSKILNMTQVMVSRKEKQILQRLRTKLQ